MMINVDALLLQCITLDLFSIYADPTYSFSLTDDSCCSRDILSAGAV